MKRFFVSSTFVDMHKERDLIQNIVQPAVDQKLRTQGESVTFSDLRWGIDTLTDSQEQRILDACFDEIDSCKPYFIVFIGTRYGWIPSDEIVRSYQDRFDEIDVFNKSVTELEILYAIKLNADRLDSCLFYFKKELEYENVEVENRILNLKRKIEKVAPSQIRYYDPVIDGATEEILSNQLIDDIFNIVSSDKPISWQERIANQMKVKFDTALPDISVQWLDDLKNTEYTDLAIFLFPDCKVKESLLLNFVLQMQTNKKTGLLRKLLATKGKTIDTIYLNVGATQDIDEIHSLQKYLIYQICGVCGIDNPSVENISIVELRDMMSDILKNYTKSRNELYIIISEYDKLIDAKNTSWLPDSIENVKWIVSLSDNSIAESLPYSTHNRAIYGVNHLDSIPCESQINAYEKISGKTLALQVKEEIKKLPYANDYMMLEIVFNCLMHFDGADIPSGDTKEIPFYMSQYIKNAPSYIGNRGEIIRYFLTSDFEKFNVPLCELIFICMAFLNRGLAVTDIEKIAQYVKIPWTELDVIRILNYESFLLTQYEDGRYDISSTALSSYFTKLYYQEFKFKYSEAIYSYLNTIPDQLSIKIDNFWLLCYHTDHFREYLNYLKSLYAIRIDNKDLKSAFLPLLSNHEAVMWMLNSFKKEKLQYESTDFVRELVSLVSSTFSASYPMLTEDFILATQNIEDLSGSLETEFRQNYVLALEKMKIHDFIGFVEHFNICYTLSHKQHKAHPPKIVYLDQDVNREFPLASLEDILAEKYGFAFVEEMAALLSKYAELPKEYQDKKSAFCYTEKASQIRSFLSRVKYIQPDDLKKVIDGKDSDTLTRQKPSLLRGHAVELSKKSDREESVEGKRNLLKEAIDIFNKILEIPEDDLVGRYKDSQTQEEYEHASYIECNRDIALCYDRLSDEQDGAEKFASLDKAYQHIIAYAKVKHNAQVLNDILRITQKINLIASQYAEPNICLQYCKSAYLAFAETTPRTKTMSFEERLLAETTEDLILKEIKVITSDNAHLRSQWIQECKNQINTFQSTGNIDAMLWMAYGLLGSYSYYVHELHLYEFTSEYIALMRSMLQALKDYLHDATINMIHKNVNKCLAYSLSEDDILSALHIEMSYAKLMMMSDIDNAMKVSSNVIDYCRSNQQSDNSHIHDIEYQAMMLNSGLCLEKNDIMGAWASIDKIVVYAEKKYSLEQNLDNLTELANAKLNQVILWDKMSAESGMSVWLLEHNKRYEAQRQLYDIYMLCYNFENKDQQLSRLMRRIRQSHEIIREKGFGYLATPKTLALVKHLKTMKDHAFKAEMEGRHEECVSIFKKLLNALRSTHFVDIYFEAEFYADLLYALGQDVSLKGKVEETLEYYKEAVSVRRELEINKITQNDANYANLTYFYAITLLSQPLTQDSLNISIDSLACSNRLFKAIIERLDVRSLKNYASCCFNFGLMLYLYTSSEKELGLSFIRDAIDIGERLVNNYGESLFQADVELFRRRYADLQHGRIQR